MEERCLINLNKQCNECGECDRCDLDRNKICDSCGKCLEENDREFRKVVVDEIVEDDYDEFDTFDILQNFDLKNEFAQEEEESEDIDYIDDFEGLVDAIEDPKDNAIEEVFPGFFRAKKLNNKEN